MPSAFPYPAGREPPAGDMIANSGDSADAQTSATQYTRFLLFFSSSVYLVIRIERCASEYAQKPFSSSSARYLSDGFSPTRKPFPLKRYPSFFVTACDSSSTTMLVSSTANSSAAAVNTVPAASITARKRFSTFFIRSLSLS